MKFNKILIIISLILIFCISLGVVSATDAGDLSNDINVDNIAIQNGDLDKINIVGEFNDSNDVELLVDSNDYLKNANGNKEVYVSANGNDVDGDGSYNNPFATLDYALNVVDDNGKIIVIGEIILDNQVTINKPITLSGIDNGTLSGNNTHSIFNIRVSNVAISNLTFVNCSANDHEGGAIYFFAGGSVSGCSFVNCSAKYGGAIYCGDSVVSGCSFVGCNASIDGGAIYFKDIGSVLNCNFTYSYARGYGGAIFGRDIVLRGCSFVGCSADKGGAIDIGGIDSVVSGCSFVNCSAKFGGAIRIDSKCSVNYCIFDNNKADYGSAIYMGYFSIDVDYNFFAFQNNVTSFPDDLIFRGEDIGGDPVTPNNWVVLNIIKLGDEYVVKFVLNNGSDLTNVMPDYNASLTINDNSEDICIKNNTFNGTFVLGDYVLNSINSANILVRTYFAPEDSFTTLNELINSENNTIILNHSYKFYDGVDNQFKNGISISKNNLIIDGNGFAIDGFNLTRVFDVSGSNVTIKNINFVNCSSSDYGGAICFQSGSSGVVRGCGFVNCSADGGGAICFGDGAIGNVSGCNFTYSYASGYRGGAIYFSFSASGVVSGCGFVNCSANDGGAISGSDIVVSGCSFVNCSGSDYYGGAIYIMSGSVSGCSFVNCSANDGGAICFYSGASGVVSGCGFVNCSARDGGAICFYSGSSGVVSGCSFVNCSASDGGGAIYFNDGRGSVNYCIFDNNKANDGSAIYFRGTGSINVNFNFFAFQNNVTTFPSDLIVGAKLNNWVVLDIVNSGDKYVVHFVLNNGSSLNESMPDYNAILTINDETKDICIKNNTFNGTFVNGNYLLTNLNTDSVLVNTTFNRSVEDYRVVTFDCEYGETATVVVIVPSDVTGNCTVTVDDGQVITGIIKNGCVNILIKGLSIGTHVLNISYSGSEGYLPFNTSANVTVSKSIEFDMNVSVEDITYGENATVFVTLPEDATGKVTIIVYNAGYNLTRTMDLNLGKVNLTLEGLDVGIYYVNVSYSGDGIYAPTVNNTNFRVINEDGDSFTDLNLLISGDDRYILLDKDYKFYEHCDTEFINGIVIGNNVVIDGAGHTIDGFNLARVFDVHGSNVTIKNINFINANSSSGGAICWAGANGSVSDCSFVDCSSYNLDGGAIFWAFKGNNGSVMNCIFVNCSVKNQNGGAIGWHANNGVVSGCNFINCSADIGGSIYWNAANNGVVSGCNFTNSNANLGGAIYLFSCDIFNVKDCSFINSTASNGNAIYIISDTYLNITDSTCIPVSGDDIAAIYVDDRCYILSDVVITTLNGKDKVVMYEHPFNITATVSTSNMSVAGGIVNLTVNNTVLEASDVNGVYSAEYLVDFYGTKVVSATYLNGKGNQEVIKYNLISKYYDIEVNASGVYDDCIIGSINTTYKGIISLEIEGSNISANVSDGQYIISIGGIDAKTYIDVPVIFVSNDKKFIGSTLINLTIKPKTVPVIASIYDGASGVNLKGILVADGKIGNVSVDIGGKIYNGVMSEDGSFVLIGTKSLDSGNYNNIVLNFVSNDGNYAGNTTVNFTIVKAPTMDDITVSGNYSQTISFNMTIHNATDGDVIVLHLPNGTNITGTINGDLVEFTVTLPFACNCNTPVFYIKDSMSYDIAYVTWNIDKISTNIGFNVTNITSEVGENKTIEVTVLDVYGNPVKEGKINVTGESVTLLNSDDGIYNLVDGKATVKINYATEGRYILNVKYLGGVATNNTDNYYTSYNLLYAIIGDVKLNTYIVSDYVGGKSAFDGKYGEQLTFNFTVYDNDGLLVNGGNLTIWFKGKAYTKEVVNGHVSITNKDFVLMSSGLYNYIVDYRGVDDYLDSFNLTAINIPKVETQITIDGTVTDDSVKDGKVTLTINVTDVNNEVIVNKGFIYYVTPDGIGHSVNIINGTANIVVEVNRTGKYYIAVSYIDLGGDFLYSEADFTWNIQKTSTLISVSKNGNDVIVTINVGDELGNTANGKLDLFVNSKLMNLNIVNGLASVNIGAYNGPIELNAVFTDVYGLTSSDRLIVEFVETPINGHDVEEVESGLTEVKEYETAPDEVDDENDTTSEDNDVKEASISGIPMQHTALPILALIFALLVLPLTYRRD